MPKLKKKIKCYILCGFQTLCMRWIFIVSSGGNVVEMWHFRCEQHIATQCFLFSCSPFFDDKWPIVSLGDPCSCGGVCSSTVLSVLSVLKKAQIDDRREMGTNWLSACHEKFTPHSWLSQGEQLAPKCHICSTHKNTISIFSRPKETKRDNSLESNLQSLFFCLTQQYCNWPKNDILGKVP